MTSRQGSGSTSTREVTPCRCKGIFDLGEELVRGDTESEEREAKDGVAGQGERVLPNRVTDHLTCPRVLDAVDLDHQLPRLPVHIEVVRTVLGSAQHLTGRLRNAPPTALTCDIELPERTDTVEQVVQDPVDEGAPAV